MFFKFNVIILLQAQVAQISAHRNHWMSVSNQNYLGKLANQIPLIGYFIFVVYF